MVTADINIEPSVLASSVDAAFIRNILAEVYDPEVPVLNILDLGIVRDIHFDATTNLFTIVITPTYSGCPAMDTINMNIRFALIGKGVKNYVIKTELSPAWTTAWMTVAGKQKLKAYGIAPPFLSNNNELFGTLQNIECPRCRSSNTEIISEFGSTACKSLYKCLDCKEPFDYFKCH